MGHPIENALRLSYFTKNKRHTKKLKGNRSKPLCLLSFLLLKLEWHAIPLFEGSQR